MKLHENTISLEEVAKIVTNKKLQKGDLETFLFPQEGKNIFSFKNKVDINVNLSEEIKNNKNVSFILASDSTIFGGSDLKILAINNCRIEVGNSCQIWTDNNCEVICGRNCEIDCENNCKITVRKDNEVITGNECQINYNGHGSDFEKDIQKWTIGENNKFFVGVLEYFVNKKSQL